MKECARMIIDDCLVVSEDEEVGIVWDQQSEIVDAFQSVVADRHPYRMIEIPYDRPHSSAIPGVADDLVACDVVVAPTAHSISHSPETTRARESGTRFITMPGITEDLFLKIQDADPASIDQLNQRLYDQVREAKQIHVSTPSGTDITIQIGDDRDWHLDGMVVSNPGELANLPAGEIFTAPLETEANGTITIDRWREITPDQHAKIAVREGKIEDWNRSAEQYVEFLKEGGEQGMVIAELGIGTNRSHQAPIGHILHDEKIYGTCHIAFGMNTSLGGDNEADVHEDVILLDPDIQADQNPVHIGGS